MVICGSYMCEFSISKDIKDTLSTSADERSVSEKVGRHP